MSKSSLSKLKNEMASDLMDFGSELYRKGIITDDEPFKTASAQCKSGPIPTIKGKSISYNKSWGYNLANVIFKSLPRERPHIIHPTGASITSIVMDAIVIGNEIESSHVSDPLAHLEINIVINAKMKNGEPLISCWHLDRDLEGNLPPEDMHPVYHFSFGGKRLQIKDQVFNYGSSIFLNTPRFAHLPLDAILGVDFVLSNYYGSQRTKMCNESALYKKYLRNLQDMFWRPYAFACTTHWTPYTPQSFDWPTEKIWPQLISKETLVTTQAKPRSAKR